MSKWLQTVIGLAILVVAGSISFTCWRLSKALDQWGMGGAQSFTQLNATLAKINGPNGTIAELDKTILAVKSLEVHADIAVAHEDRQLTVLDAQEQQLFNDLHSTANALTGTATALTETAHSASGALDEGQRTIKGLQPLEVSLTATAGASTATINTFNAKLDDPHIDSLISHLDSTAGHIDGISGDMNKIADKTTGDYLTPKPWWQKIGPFANDLVRAGCLLTGRCP